MAAEFKREKKLRIPDPKELLPTLGPARSPTTTTEGSPTTSTTTPAVLTSRSTTTNSVLPNYYLMERARKMRRKTFLRWDLSDRGM